MKGDRSQSKQGGSSARKTAASAKKAVLSDERRLREAIMPYVSPRRLQCLAAHSSESIQKALLLDPPPPEIQGMLNVLAAVLRPLPTEQIDNPGDVAALLMVEMSHLAQEQMRVICLNTQMRVQTIQTVYRGSLNTMVIRGIELFREAFRHNSAAIILAHNHPSGDPTPLPNDLAITRQAIRIGALLNVTVLDHLIIGRGRWVSLRAESTVFAEMEGFAHSIPEPLDEPDLYGELLAAQADDDLDA